MNELLAKIRAARPETEAGTKAKCHLLAEVYVEASQVLAKLGQSTGEAKTKQGIDVAKFDTLLDEIERLLDEIGQLFMPPEIKELFKTLESRFKENPQRHEGVTWQQVEQKLKNAPREKLQSLLEMEKTGGEPDVIKIDRKTGEIVFYDCSKESPSGRRNCVYDKDGEEQLKREYPDRTCNGNAVDMAKKMGVEMLNESEYRELQTKGEYDQNSWSWIKTPIDKRRSNVALVGHRFAGVADIRGFFPNSNPDLRGWRASLKI